MRQNDHTTTPNDEINLFDVVRFLGENWKTIGGVCAAGAIAAGAFLAVVPKQYDADALIEVAQVLVYPNKDNNNNLQRASFEAPALLIERLKQPTTYSPETIKACSPNTQLPGAENVASMVQAGLSKTVGSLVEITVRRNTPELAKQCADAVFSMIRTQQNELIKPYQAELNNTLKELEDRFTENQAFVSKMEKAGLYQTVYLAKRDEALYLTQQINQMKRAISFTSEARLVAPIYAQTNPISPVRSKVLVFGTMAGLLLGLLVALLRHALKKWRNTANPI